METLKIGDKGTLTYKSLGSSYENAELAAFEWNEEKTPIFKVSATDYVSLSEKWEFTKN